ncbi:hypothetical protein GCM10009850_037630 [Nonomuraea monospora]|uniref:DUF4158 domain-containing protein n=1 Tax=Nonomuraea monospora TaxID=568818 RepID=A0ABN3CFY5_9ACTN
MLSWPVAVWGWSMSTRMFSENQLERLRSYPDISREDLIRYFTLTPADLAFIDPGAAAARVID